MMKLHTVRAKATGEQRVTRHRLRLEAFCKASGIDLEHIMLGKKFALLRDSTGKPEISLTGDLAMSDSNVLVSISHEKEYACAMVVIEKF